MTRYVFEGEQFATRLEAERARAEKIRAIARAFYVELPAALACAAMEDDKLKRATRASRCPRSSFDRLRT